MDYLKKIKRIMFNKPFVVLFRTFFNEIFQGYLIYCRIIKAVDKNTHIIVCSPRGTGDIYIIGKYFKNYIIENDISKYEFVFRGKSEQKIGKLFGIYGSIILNDEEIWLLNRFKQFIGPNNLKIIELHHYAYPVQAHAKTILFEGYNGWTFEQLIKKAGIRLKNDRDTMLPRFISVNSIGNIFKMKGLLPGKTVILAPFSSSAYILNYEWWYSLASELKKMGFSVATNVVNTDDIEILGTVPLNIHYEELRSYLEYAGYFIAARSGLCDIIEGLKCKKIVLTPYWNENLPWKGCPGKTLDFYGMEKNYKDRTIYEIEYDTLSIEETRKDIINLFLSNFKFKNHTKSNARKNNVVIHKQKKNALAYFVDNFSSEKIQISVHSAICNIYSEFDIYIFTLKNMVNHLKTSLKDYEKVKVIEFDPILLKETYGYNILDKFRDIFIAILPYILSDYEKLVYASDSIVFNSDLHCLDKIMNDDYMFYMTEDLAYRSYINSKGKKIQNNLIATSILIEKDIFPNIDIIFMNAKKISDKLEKKENLAKLFTKYENDIASFYISECLPFIKFIPQKYNFLVGNSAMIEFFCKYLHNEKLYMEYIETKNNYEILNFKNKDSEIDSRWKVFYKKYKN